MVGSSSPCWLRLCWPSSGCTTRWSASELRPKVPGLISMSSPAPLRLIPNLVETRRFTRRTKWGRARSRDHCPAKAMSAQGLEAKAVAENQLSQSLKVLFALAEAGTATARRRGFSINSRAV